MSLFTESKGLNKYLETQPECKKFENLCSVVQMPNLGIFQAKTGIK